ncbi:CgeB family protein [Vineibacter terrae]|uniref:CgeB family protein n=1 Tax=Vineibacter terrae TaxID=2586908 RepID=UPI0015B41384|nr:glycosyltransferase [Vineibacter terrae]
MVVFSTLPDALNRNASLELYASEALARLLDVKVARTSASLARETVLALKPALVIGIGSVVPDHVDYAAVARACRRVQAPLVYWLHDDPYEFDYNWKIEGGCDWIFTSDRATIDFYRTSAVSHLPLAADVTRHFRPIVPIRERGTDVFFCGVGYPNRRTVVSTIRDVLRACATEIRGDGWDERLPFCRNERLSPEAMIDRYAAARIVLNIGRQFNIGNRQYDLVPSTPGPRLFEAAAAGCVQAAFLESVELFDYFARDTEILAFSSVGEFADIVDHVRGDPDAATALADRAQARARAEHTYDHRMLAMLDVLQRNRLFNPAGAAARSEDKTHG